MCSSSSSSGSTAHGAFQDRRGGEGEVEEEEDTRREHSRSFGLACFSPQASCPSAEVCTGKNSQDFRTLCNMFHHIRHKLASQIKHCKYKTVIVGVLFFLRDCLDKLV